VDHYPYKIGSDRLDLVGGRSPQGLLLCRFSCRETSSRSALNQGRAASSRLSRRRSLPCPTGRNCRKCRERCTLVGSIAHSCALISPVAHRGTPDRNLPPSELWRPNRVRCKRWRRRSPKSPRKVQSRHWRRGVHNANRGEEREKPTPRMPGECRYIRQLECSRRRY
jgi:hypothetical protein